jgi:hypothetical protein
MSPKHAGLGLLLLLGMTLPIHADDGSRFFCRWEPDGLFYEIKVEKTQNDQSFVRYTMDGTTEWVPNWRLGKWNVAVGERVEAKWWKDKLFYQATVARRDGDNIRIRYTSDGSEEDTTISMLRLKLIHPEGRKVGEEALGRWAADGYWYTGKIQEIREGKYRVVFDDGDEAWLPAGHVLPYLPTFDDAVEAKWSRDGKFYKARIAKRDGHKVRVEWEDGTSEETTMRHLRVDADRFAIRYIK